MAVRGVNKVILVGFMGQDPEVRYMPNGGAVASLSLATSETWRDKATGEQKEKTEWHRVVLFGKLAEVAGEFLRKGAQVYIEGQLRTRNWQDNNGVTRYTTEIVVGQNGTMQMLGGRRDGGASQQDGQQFSGQSQPASQNPVPDAKKTRGKGKKNTTQPEPQSQPQPQDGAFPPMDFDDDIPF